MCGKCAELDGKIDHYQRLSRMIDDKAVLDGIKQLIEQMTLKRPRFVPSKLSKGPPAGVTPAVS
jgi:hypothetical protein